MTVTLESAVFMGKNYLNNCQSIVNTTDLTLKQMFDISTRLVSEQVEIPGLETIGWGNHSWSVLCFGKIFENPESNDAWEQRLGWLKSSSKYRNFDRIDGEPMEFEWNIFPGFNALQLSDEVKSLLLRLNETLENFTGTILFMSMFNDIPVGQKTMKMDVWQMLDSYLGMQEDLEKGQWSFIGPGSEKKWCSIKEGSPQGIWDKIAERMLLEFAESGCPIFCATT